MRVLFALCLLCLPALAQTFPELTGRVVEVLGDAGIATAVGAEEWRGVIEAGAGAMGEGRPADALVAAVARIGAILARHVPPEPEARDELPNRVVVI